MTKFDRCLAFVLKQEGGYCDDPLDNGGATNKGITQRVYDDYRLRRSLCRMPVVGISANEIHDIYRRRYWEQIRGDLLPDGIDLVMFDAAVNSGVSQSAKFLQRALGVPDDGVIGQITVDAALMDERIGMAPAVIKNMLDQRREFFEKICARNPTQKRFLKGWLNRVAAVEREVARGN